MGKLIPYSRNARIIPPSAVDKVANCIKEFGCRQNIRSRQLPPAVYLWRMTEFHLSSGPPKGSPAHGDYVATLTFSFPSAAAPCFRFRSTAD